MTAYSLGELRTFSAGETKFAYVVPSGGIFQLNEVAEQILNTVGEATLTREALVCELIEREYLVAEVEECIDELLAIRALRESGRSYSDAPQALPDRFPLQTMVLNITNQCNLSCQYCYEFGEDKIATPEGKKKFMDLETARQSVDFLFRQAEGRSTVHITFFGGETLMNFPLMKQVVDYANEQSGKKGFTVDYSLTTNATLLTPAIIDFLAENRVGVTVSIDGPKEANDKFRIFANGRGSYEVMEPKIRELLDRHRTRPIAARVTMTSQAMDVMKTYRHLKENLGFHEVGFAPVTTSPNRLYSINEPGMDKVLGQFEELAEEYLQNALRNQHHGFSNVSDTLAELHQGVNKSHPCGAGLGLLGVGPSGDIAPCHRFVDSDQHALGHVSTGLDSERQKNFLDRGNVSGKYECQTCWARPLCAGGCHHEAFVRYGDTGHPNLHYCDWIRSWTDTCLHIYGTIAAQNPGFLEHFSERKAQ